MQLIDAIRNDKGSIVVVDDDFSPPNFDTISEHALTAQFNLVNTDSGAKSSLAKLLGQGDNLTPGDITKLAQQKAGDIWRDYLATPEKYPFLHPLLSDFRATYTAQRARIDALVAFLKDHFGVEPLTFASMEEAKDHIKICMLAFVDFFINVNNEEEAIAQHSQFKAELSAPFRFNDSIWPKLVFLVSSRLPQREGLHKFRSATGIKSAFFLAFEKNQINNDYLARNIDGCIGRYIPSTQLNSYLTSIDKAINDAAVSLSDEVSRLELHDLTTLKTLRLDAASESLQGYLTWLLAEALAVKLRGARSLQDPLLPSETSFVPLDGKLLPRSVLFELFSEIAVGPPARDANSRLVFGDILAGEEWQPGGVRPLLLVIAPACDLIRCSDGYEVLCVHGALTAEGASLGDLLDKNYSFGKGHVVLRTLENGGNHYSIVQWDDKRVCTTPYAELSNAKAFKRIARLSEVFTQEVKEMALARLSRVGTPVDPSFSVVLHCLVRLKLSLGGKDNFLIKVEDLSGKDFVSAISAMGRDADSDTKTVIFSHQFQDWLVSEFLPGAILEAGENGTKLQAAKDFFVDASNLKVPFQKGKNTVKRCEGFVAIQCVDQLPEDEQQENALQILLTPYQDMEE